MKTYLNNLTPLRGIAALLTVLYHVDLMIGGGGGMLIPFDNSHGLMRLYLMVDFFFVLSGFVLAYVYGASFANGVTRSAFWKFTVARFARIYPLHLATLAYCVLLTVVTRQIGIAPNLIGEIGNTPYAVFTNLFLLHAMNLHDWFSWNHASWSISVEWWAYMIFPVLVAPLLALGPRGRLAVAAGCVAGYVAITVLIVPIVTVPPEIPFVRVDPSELSINVAYQYGYLRCLCGFILGMVTQQAYDRQWARGWLASGTALVGLALVVFACMHVQVPDAATVLVFPLIILAGAYGSAGIDRFFARRALQRLGDWSYSIYLVHQPLLFTFGAIAGYLALGQTSPAPTGPPAPPTLLTGWLIASAFILLTLGVSYLTYTYLEVPARNWINKARRPPTESVPRVPQPT